MSGKWFYWIAGLLMGQKIFLLACRLKKTILQIIYLMWRSTRWCLLVSFFSFVQSRITHVISCILNVNTRYYRLACFNLSLYSVYNILMWMTAYFVYVTENVLWYRTVEESRIRHSDERSQSCINIRAMLRIHPVVNSIREKLLVLLSQCLL